MVKLMEENKGCGSRPRHQVARRAGPCHAIPRPQQLLTADPDEHACTHRPMQLELASTLMNQWVNDLINLILTVSTNGTAYIINRHIQLV